MNGLISSLLSGSTAAASSTLRPHPRNAGEGDLGVVGVRGRSPGSGEEVGGRRGGGGEEEEVLERGREWSERAHSSALGRTDAGAANKKERAHRL